MYPTQPTELPLPPKDALARFTVDEPRDNRFQACARLLQSYWREARGLPMGSYINTAGIERPLGSRLRKDFASAGHNYLTPEIARLARAELAFRERGALIDEARAWENLLSSTALTFNLFCPLKLNAELAKDVTSKLIGEDVAEVTAVRFETSPGRGDESYTGDFTAFDVLIAYLLKDGTSGFIAIEVKYAESFSAPAASCRPHHVALTEGSRLYRSAGAENLRKPLIEQFVREHLLCHTMLHRKKLFDRGHFLVVSPRLNADVSRAVSIYQAELSKVGVSLIPFDHITIEQITGMISAAGGSQLASLIDERYLDLAPIQQAITDWTPFTV